MGLFTVDDMNPENNRKILAFLRDHLAEMVALLTRLVEMESPTGDKRLLDRLGAFLAEELRGLGASVTTLPQVQAGDQVCARWGEGPGGVLLLGHMDTVWDAGTLAQRPVHSEGGKLYGPGAEDMKGGIVIAMWAIRAMRELKLPPAHPITLLLNSDEETGSSSSRPIIESEARRHEAVFVLEPAQAPHGSLKTWRKGVGEYRVAVTGKAAHAGVDHQQGVNAIEELAHQILTIQGFTDYAAGTTFNVGIAGGGSRSNVVPAEAWADVDVRVITADEAARVATKMQSLAAHLPGAHVEVSGGLNRPPMQRTSQIAALYTRAAVLAGEMGIPISEAGTGGGSDGNFTAALGVPTLDGMGAVGDGGHAIHEHVVMASLPERAAVLAAMLR